jgi:hypothetical protein
MRNADAKLTSQALLISAMFCAALLSLCAMLQFGCSPSAKNEPQIATGKVLSAAEIRAHVPAWCGDETYAVLNEAWVQWHYAKFRSDLSAGAFGIVSWDAKFDCNRFAAKLAADAHVAFFQRTFHSFLPAKAPAIGFVWYYTGAGSGHAEVIVWTEKGVRLLEPQTGNIRALPALNLYQPAQL